MEKICLGRLIESGELTWLSKHSWDCNWYWAFGYLGNRNCHWHFESLLEGNQYHVKDLFNDTTLTQADWWIMRDLFTQAYALKKAAEVYRHGGHQSSKKGVTDIIQSKDMENRINQDLKMILDELWNYLISVNARLEENV